MQLHCNFFLKKNHIIIIYVVQAFTSAARGVIKKPEDGVIDLSDKVSFMCLTFGLCVIITALVNILVL